MSLSTQGDPHGDAPHASEAVANAAEHRWAIMVGLIILSLIAMMVFTGVYWAAMPPSRVETVDVKTLHLKGEFVENNLGTAIEKDGRVVVRLIAQQYSFTPQCIVVPAGISVTFRGTSTDAIHGFVLVTFRGTSTDAIHGFVVGRTNANTMLIPGFVSTFTTSFPKAGELLMPCHEYCGTGHEAMWARVQVISPEAFFAKASAAERLSCVSR